MTTGLMLTGGLQIKARRVGTTVLTERHQSSCRSHVALQTLPALASKGVSAWVTSDSESLFELTRFAARTMPGDPR